MHWTTKENLMSEMQKFWDRGLLLKEYLKPHSDFFPKRLIFKSPNSRELSDQFGQVKTWIADIEKISGLRIVYKKVRHAIIGENNIPREAWLDSLDSAIVLLGQQQGLRVFTHLIATVRQRNPR